MRRTSWAKSLPFVLLLFGFCLGVAEPRFLSEANATNLSRQLAIVLLFSAAQLLPMLTRGLDLSQGGTIAIVSVVFALSAHSYGIYIGAAVATLIGAFAGCIAGALVAWLSLSPFVVTLGVFSILQGTALILSNGQPVYDVPSNFSNLGWGQLGPVPNPALAAIIVLGLVAAGLHQTTWGRAIYAVGSNERAARLSGIPTRYTKLLVYTACALLTSVGALVLSSRIQSGHPTTGADTALKSIAACVIGGVSLNGGRGTILGVVLGSIVLAVLSNALNLLNISSYVQQVVVGGTIILAVVVDRWNAVPE